MRDSTRTLVWMGDPLGIERRWPEAPRSVAISRFTARAAARSRNGAELVDSTTTQQHTTNTECTSEDWTTGLLESLPLDLVALRQNGLGSDPGLEHDQKKQPHEGSLEASEWHARRQPDRGELAVLFDGTGVELRTLGGSQSHGVEVDRATFFCLDPTGSRPLPLVLALPDWIVPAAGVMALPIGNGLVANLTGSGLMP